MKEQFSAAGPHESDAPQDLASELERLYLENFQAPTQTACEFFEQVSLFDYSVASHTSDSTGAPTGQPRSA